MYCTDHKGGGRPPPADTQEGGRLEMLCTG